MDKIRIAVGGASMRGEYLAKLFTKTGEAEIVAIADPVVARAAYLKEQHNFDQCKVFDSIEAALAEVECDAVVAASSDAHHAEVALPGLAAGKFVFCEKPLETTIEKCRAIIEADAKAGYKTFAGLNMRYSPVYSTIKRELDKGVVGDILTIESAECYDGGRTYFRRWNRLRAEGGGLWITKATHDFDMLAWLAGAAPLEVSAAAAKTYYVPKPEAAAQCRHCKLAPECPDKAREPNQLLVIREENGGEPYDLCLYNSDSDTFDHGVAAIRFEKDIFVTHSCSVVSGLSERRIRVSGTKGALGGAEGKPIVTLWKRDPSETVEIPVTGSLEGGHGGADRNIGTDFIAFVKGECEPKCRPAEAAIAVQIGLAATRSGDERRSVKISEFKL